MKKLPTSNTVLQWFRNASPYINFHRGRTFVLQFGGELLTDAGTDNFFNDVALLSSLGIRLVLVHGIRPQIEQRCLTHGLDSEVHQGIRVTDSKTLPLVIDAAGSTRVVIEARLSNRLPNTPMSGSQIRISSGNFVIAQPMGVHEGVDFCHSGTVRRIDAQAIRSHLDLGQVVLLSPLGYSPTGETFNLLAEQVATEVAIALHADKLIFVMSEGHLRDGRRQVISQLDPQSAEKLLHGKRQLGSETASCLTQAVRACRHGVSRTHLVGYHEDGALLKELFSRDGVGTLVSAEPPEGPRAAKIEDVGGLLELIKPLEEAGILVRRSREQLELEIGNYQIIAKENMVIACAALYTYPEEQVAEMACIAVHPDYKSTGRGDQLLSRVEKIARKQGIKRLFVLTTQTAHWFRERDFEPGALEDLPLKRRELYNYQRNSKIFFKAL